MFRHEAIGFAQGAATIYATSVPQTTEPGPTVSKDVPSEGNGGNVPAISGQNQLPSNVGEVKEKKKTHFQGRAKGIGALPKGKGSTASAGWTGAGFDADART